MALTADYADRVYAGVLGKVIGVYLGRPFEGAVPRRFGDARSAVECDLNFVATLRGMSGHHEPGVFLCAGPVAFPEGSAQALVGIE